MKKLSNDIIIIGGKWGEIGSCEICHKQRKLYLRGVVSGPNCMGLEICMACAETRICY